MSFGQQKWDMRLGTWPVTAALAYFIAGVTIYRWALNMEGLAMVWPAAGIFVATFLLTRRSQWPAVAILFCLVSVAGGWVSGMGPVRAAVYIAAYLVHALVCAAIFGKFDTERAFSTTVDLGRFCLATVASVAASCAIIFLGGLGWTLTQFLNWSATLGLGTLIVAPMIVAVAREVQENRARWTKAYAAEVSGLLALVMAVTWFIATQASYPLLFVPFAAAVLVTYRLGLIGAAACIASIAAVGIYTLSFDTYALHPSGRSKMELVNFYQFYLLVIISVCLPLAALRTEGHDLMRRLKTNRDLLATAEGLANFGHWHMDMRTRVIVWSEGFYRIYGLPSSTRPTVKLTREFFHPEDREQAFRKLEHCIEHGGTIYGTPRIVRPDGTIRHVESILMSEVDEHGRTTAIFGTFQDVTERVRALEDLESAKKVAEAEAFAARLLAETDQLTGLNNRRKILDLLSVNLVNCAETGRTMPIAILDIDHFKSINDQFGHAMGDQVLRKVATICRETIRENGFVGRLGGEEFLFLFPGLSEARARELVELVRLRLQEKVWEEMDGLPVTGSFGMATTVDGADETWLLQAADNALYEAKRAGRNCLKIAA